MFWLLIVLIGIVYLVFHRMGSRKKFVALSKQLPGGLPSYPIIGHSYLLMGLDDEEVVKKFEYLGKIAIERGGLATFWFNSYLFIMVCDPAAAESLLQTCLEKHSTTNNMKLLLGNGSIFAPVSIWRPRRKLLIPNFSIKKLNRFVDIFAKQSAVMVEQLQPSVDKGTFSVWKYMIQYTFNSLCETSLGVSINGQTCSNHLLLNAFDRAAKLAASRAVRPWLHPECVYRLLPQYKEAVTCRKVMNEFIDEIIQGKRKEMEEKQREADYAPKSDLYLGFQSLLELLLETSLKIKGLTNLELREEMITMSVAGTDTSAVGACFTLVLLSRHPEIQEKVFEELQEVCCFADKPVTAADLPRLKYLEAVLKETLRLYPPVAHIARTVHSDTELQSGIIVPKGTGLFINIWAIHRNPRYWGEDAELFRPERFFERLSHAAQYIPFSYGLRNCIGYQYAMMSMKTTVATILRQYKILPPAGADVESLKEPLRVKYEVMMKAVDNFQIQIEKRDSTGFENIGRSLS